MEHSNLRNKGQIIQSLKIKNILLIGIVFWASKRSLLTHPPSIISSAMKPNRSKNS